MASLLRKLQKPSPTRVLTALNSPHAPSFSFPLLQPHLSESTANPHYRRNLVPISCSPSTDKSITSHPPQIYPSFSFGFFLNHISSNGLFQSESEEGVSGGSSTIRADSVKKKRKKKMNKHKYRKLRKRLRQKS